MTPQQRTGISQPPLDPNIVNGFDGMNFLDSVNGYVPPDTIIGVGPQYVVETVNAQIQFYDKVTGAALLPNTPLNVFFNQPSESPFDPNVTYDDIAGRFIVTASTFSNHELMAVSKDSNPLDGFNTYDLDVSEGGNFPDFPKLGYNADEVVLTLNMYPGPSALPRPGAARSPPARSSRPHLLPRSPWAPTTSRTTAPTPTISPSSPRRCTEPRRARPCISSRRTASTTALRCSSRQRPTC